MIESALSAPGDVVGQGSPPRVPLRLSDAELLVALAVQEQSLVPSMPGVPAGWWWSQPEPARLAALQESRRNLVRRHLLVELGDQVSLAPPLVRLFARCWAADRVLAVFRTPFLGREEVWVAYLGPAARLGARCLRHLGLPDGMHQFEMLEGRELISDLKEFLGLSDGYRVPCPAVRLPEDRLQAIWREGLCGGPSGAADLLREAGVPGDAAELLSQLLSGSATTIGFLAMRRRGRTIVAARGFGLVDGAAAGIWLLSSAGESSESLVQLETVSRDSVDQVLTALCDA
ncbi:MAG: hypothetical protein ACRDJK_10370 [Actinomycetota bacterium]